MTEKVFGGLRPKTRDDRDRKLGALVTLPPLSELPDEFSFDYNFVKNQGDTDFCTGFASCGASELQEGVELCPEWVFAMGKWLSGDPVDSFGLEIRYIMKAQTKVGAIKKIDSEYSLHTHDQYFLRRIENWPEELKEKAKKHQKQSYVDVTGPYDHFDNIRATIWKYRHEKRVPIFGVVWEWALSQVEMEKYKEEGTGHCIFALGWTKRQGVEYLIIQNSYGTQAGENGRHYFSRDVINKNIDLYGAYMFIDMPLEDIDWYTDNHIKIGENPFLQIMKVIFNFIIDFLFPKK